MTLAEFRHLTDLLSPETPIYIVDTRASVCVPAAVLGLEDLAPDDPVAPTF